MHGALGESLLDMINRGKGRAEIFHKPLDYCSGPTRREDGASFDSAFAYVEKFVYRNAK